MSTQTEKLPLIAELEVKQYHDSEAITNAQDENETFQRISCISQNLSILAFLFIF